ncbi:hypothetical protein VKT23_017492 [Stygiomarasmius scandens]|uniref:Uncharacterized protein n=1 Tax=Marasmiellus scandens TaxID=2682957 RepID=A0ABR1IS70_9AGAR
MSETNTQLPQHAIAFSRMFPKGRLCRFVNRRSGTLLDVHPDFKFTPDEVPKVVGNPESASGQYASWIVTPHGDGQAIIPVPKDGSSEVKYLTPSTLQQAIISTTISPFPTSWTLVPTADSPKSDPLIHITSPPGLYEQWTCQISWPHFRDQTPYLLDLANGSADADTPVVIWPYTALQWQFWQIQFVR